MYTYVGSFVHPTLPAFLLCTCGFVHEDRRVVNNKFLFSSGMDFRNYDNVSFFSSSNGLKIGR